VSLGSKGSCQIGGNIATQAGGTLYFKHGSIRNHIRGMEVVLANGEILDLESIISKDNIGPDLKELFVGSEGTLGVITKVNISCPRADSNQEVLFMKISGYENVFKMVNLTKKHFNHDLTALEYLDYYSYCGIDKYFSN
jgi:D-2-hydroxyglutarate dehydrogenase